MADEKPNPQQKKIDLIKERRNDPKRNRPQDPNHEKGKAK